MMLASGRLGGAAKERIFDAVASGVRPRRSVFALPGLFALGALAAGVAALLIVPRLNSDGFTAKGTAAGAPALQLSCAGGTLEACPVGSRLLFVADGAERGYLAAWADPAAGGERIWYFSRDGQSPALVTGAGTQVAPKAILLGPEHAPGDYVVHVLVTDEPLGRAELAARPAAIAQQQFTLHVIAR